MRSCSFLVSSRWHSASLSEDTRNTSQRGAKVLGQAGPDLRGRPRLTAPTHPAPLASCPTLLRCWGWNPALAHAGQALAPPLRPALSPQPPPSSPPGASLELAMRVCAALALQPLSRLLSLLALLRALHGNLPHSTSADSAHAQEAVSPFEGARGSGPGGLLPPSHSIFPSPRPSAMRSFLLCLGRARVVTASGPLYLLRRSLGLP